MTYIVGQIFEKREPEVTAWCNENGYLFRKIESGYQIQSYPELSLEDLKEAKLDALEKAQHQAEAQAYIQSSVGFEINAGERANRDIGGLLVTTKETDTVQFCDYHNELHPVTLAQLKLMQAEIIQNAQYIYAQKWAYRDAINAAESVEALEEIEISFKYLDIYEDVNIDDSEVG